MVAVRAARFALFSVVLFALAAAAAAETAPDRRSPGRIHGPEAPFSSFPTPAFDATGRLWLAFVEGDSIYVTSSDDGGRTFALAVPVNRGAEKIDANGEGRPKIAVTKNGTLLVTWTEKLEKPYSGLIRFSRSTDAGRSFAPPVTLNDDGLETGHRFDALAVAPSGAILVAWIDKRDLERARSEGKPYAGAAVYVAVSRDEGRTFEPNRKVKDNVCECCRLSFAFDENGEASLLFRDIVDGGIRDHVLAKGVGESEPPAIHRVSFDEWKIDACPHHGPALFIDSLGRYHAAWFTAGERSGTGSRYARSIDGGRTFTSPVALGDGERATHPFVFGIGSSIYLVWMEVDGRESVVRMEASVDGGASWSAPATLARGGPGADHPLLASDGKEVFLSWFGKETGYVLLPLSALRLASADREKVLCFSRASPCSAPPSP